MPFCLAVAVTTFIGCENYLVVTTATKFGIDISQVAKQPPTVVIGYKRQETSIIPADHQNYSVLSDFCVMANPSLWDFFDTMAGKDAPDSLQIRSFFATGIAAARAANSVQTREYFRNAVLQRTNENNQKEKQCF
jgi:hypothetical protein